MFVVCRRGAMFDGCLRGPPGCVWCIVFVAIIYPLPASQLLLLKSNVYYFWWSLAGFWWRMHVSRTFQVLSHLVIVRVPVWLLERLRSMLLRRMFYGTRWNALSQMITAVASNSMLHRITADVDLDLLGSSPMSQSSSSLALLCKI